VTQLFYAAQQGHIEVVRLLLANGALATACEKSTGYSAIDVAKQVYSSLFENM
jgi:ankyrin repeat protein